MSKLLGKCNECSNCNLKDNICDADMWDRNSEDETWLHSDDDFTIYLGKERFCTEMDKEQ